MAIENIGLYPISIDVYKKHKESTIYANDNDLNSRGLLITLLKNDAAFDSTGISLKIGFRNAVGEERLYDCELVDAAQGQYKVFYPTEMLTGNGGRVVKVEIKAYEGSGALLNYSPIFVYVNASEVPDDALEGTNEGSVLLKAIAEYEAIGDEYLAAEALRDSDYASAEAGRGNSYTIRELFRDDSYATAEATRNTYYDSQEDDRNDNYQLQESMRNTQYTSSESDRDTLYATAETNRDSLYTTAESNRDGLYATAEANRDTLVNSINAQLAEKVPNFKLKNEVINGKFLSGIDNWLLSYASLISVNPSSVTILTDSGSPVRSRFYQSFGAVGDRYYVRATFKADSNLVSLRVRDATVLDVNHSGSGLFETKSMITTLLEGTREFAIRDGRTSNYTPIEIKDFLAIELLSIFGAGNEPTKLEMDELMKVIPNQWWDGELTLTQKQFITWQLNLIRKNTNAIIALGGTII